MPLWLTWIVLGLVAGSLAKYLVPGRDPSGCIVTIALGILGAVLGGLLGTALGLGAMDRPSLDLRSIAVATAGAILVLLAGRLIRGRLR